MHQLSKFHNWMLISELGGKREILQSPVLDFYAIFPHTQLLLQMKNGFID